MDGDVLGDAALDVLLALDTATAQAPVTGLLSDGTTTITLNAWPTVAFSRTSPAAQARAYTLGIQPGTELHQSSPVAPQLVARSVSHSVTGSQLAAQLDYFRDRTVCVRARLGNEIANLAHGTASKTLGFMLHTSPFACPPLRSYAGVSEAAEQVNQRRAVVRKRMAFIRLRRMQR